MQTLKDFFLLCSGVNRTLLKRTPTEVNKFVGIGATIFFTGVFAAIAAGYALYTVFDSLWVIIPIALFWGLMIFNLDRFIVSTMKKKGSFFKDFSTAAPRLILAILIAVVIAKPLELKIFESEIEAELVKMQQETYKEQDDLVQARYTAQIDSLKSDIASIKQETLAKQQERDLLVSAAIAEADGTGGSRQKNLGPIYKTKKAAADRVQSEYDEISATNSAMITAKQSQLKSVENQMTTDINTLDRVALSGFAARIEGLERATQRSSAIWIANIFIILLFIAVETAPVITKLILERSPYDYVLSKHEAKFAMSHQSFYAKHQHATAQKAKFDMETTDHQTKLAIIAEKELADEAIQRKVEELKGRTSVSHGFIGKSSLFGG